MDRAFELAGLGKPKTRSNPAVGCVIIHNDTIIGEGYHMEFGGPHAEINAISSVQSIDIGKIKEAIFYVTLEPCSMCVGAILHARVKRIVYAATDPRAGAAGSVVDLFALSHNHQVEVESGVAAEESAKLLKEFFRQRR